MTTEYEQVVAIMNARDDTTCVSFDMTETGDNVIPTLHVRGRESILLITIDQYAGPLAIAVQAFGRDGARLVPDATVVTD